MHDSRFWRTARDRFSINDDSASQFVTRQSDKPTCNGAAQRVTVLNRRIVGLHFRFDCMRRIQSKRKCRPRTLTVNTSDITFIGYWRSSLGVLETPTKLFWENASASAAAGKRHRHIQQSGRIGKPSWTDRCNDSRDHQLVKRSGE